MIRTTIVALLLEHILCLMISTTLGFFLLAHLWRFLERKMSCNLYKEGGRTNGGHGEKREEEEKK